LTFLFCTLEGSGDSPEISTDSLGVKLGHNPGYPALRDAV